MDDVQLIWRASKVMGKTPRPPTESESGVAYTKDVISTFVQWAVEWLEKRFDDFYVIETNAGWHARDDDAQQLWDGDDLPEALAKAVLSFEEEDSDG